MNTKSVIKVKVRVIWKYVHKMASRVQSTTGMHPYIQDVEFLDFLFSVSNSFLIIETRGLLDQKKLSDQLRN